MCVDTRNDLIERHAQQNHTQRVDDELRYDHSCKYPRLIGRSNQSTRGENVILFGVFICGNLLGSGPRYRTNNGRTSNGYKFLQTDILKK